MSRFGLVGPSYTLANISANYQSLINWFVSQDESGAGNAPLILDPTPGTKTFVDLGRTVSPAVDGMVAVDVDAEVDAQSAVQPIALPTQTPSGSYDSDLALFNPVSLIGGGVNPITPDPGYSSFLVGFAEVVTGPLTPTGTMANPSGVWVASSVLLGLVGGSIPTPVQAPLTGSDVTPLTGTFASTTIAGDTIIVQLAGDFSPTGPSFVISDDSAGGVNVYVPMGVESISAGINSCVVGTWICFNAAPCKNITIGDSGAGSQGPFAYAIAEFPTGSKAVTNSGPVRGLLTVVGRTFAVCGSDFDEILGNGTFVTRGTVSNDSLPVTMAATPQQLLLASAGTAYVFDLAANTLTAIPGATFAGQVSQAGLCDGFFLLTIQNSKEFYVSAPLDATDWVTNGAAIVSVFSDNIVSMLVHDREIWFWSDRDRTVYYDSGNIFPFDVIAGTTIQAGSAAKNSPARLDDHVLWLNADDNGTATVKMSSGYTPQRISNHALEFAMQGYARVDDAVGMTYQLQGHNFYALYFPTPSAMWVFDTLTGMWHEELFWVGDSGMYQAAHRWNHTYNFGMHLVGDWQSGKVYQMQIPTRSGSAWSFADDDGSTIRRARRAPHISREQKWAFYHYVNLFVESGLGPIPPLPSPAPYPTSVVLEDVDTPGTFWFLTIADDGTQNVIAGDGPAEEVLISPLDHPGKSYQLYVSSGIMIAVGSEVPFNPSYPDFFQMATITTQLSTGLKAAPPL